MTVKKGVPRASMRVRDVLATGTHALRVRPGRTTLTALGVAIGIAAILAVVGISASSRADLLAQIEALGTNLLQVRAGSALFAETAPMPADAADMIRRVGPVESAAGMTRISTAVQRTPFVPANRSGGVDLYATEPVLQTTIDARMALGRFLADGTGPLPLVVLGSQAATRLGITDVTVGPTITISAESFQVIGVMAPLPLNPDMDRAALIDYRSAVDRFGLDPRPSAVYVRTDNRYVDEVRDVLGRSANPGDPQQVEVSRPSDALLAQAQVNESFQRLLLGLGGVVLLVAAIGIANVMVISVLERRAEIGLRRALGATRRHIWIQFVVESSLLSLLGGVLGIAVGVAITVGYARVQGWRIDLPVTSLAGAVSVAVLIGGIAGMYPARKAARMDPAMTIRDR